MFVSYSRVSQKLPMDIKSINSSQSEEDKIGISALPIRNLSKKSRLIVKLKKIDEPKPIQDLFLKNTPAVSETMASKICPVCKSFSSISSTTLNAHIDQCLSGKPTIKEKTNPKVSKHKIKPRKIRLMVDIYKTALDCTLEDLDIRNRTNWATNLEELAQNLEVCAEGKKKMRSFENIEEFNENAAVYFDAKSRKLRILSKFSDSLKDDCGSGKPFKKYEGNKIFLSKKKNKFVVQKHKFLELPTEVRSGQQREYIPEQGSGEENLTRHHKTYDQMTSNGREDSKGTGLESKMICHYENQHLDKSTKNLRVKNHLLSFDKFKKRSNSNSRIQTDINPFLRKQKENLLCNSHEDKYKEKHRPRKMGFSSLDSRDFPGNDNRVFSNVKRFRKVGLSVREKSMDPPNGIENHVLARNSDKMVMEKKSLVHRISSGDKKFSFLRKNHLSVSELKRSPGRKRLNFKKPRLCYTSSSDEEAQMSRFEICRNSNPFQEPEEHSVDMEMGFEESSGNLKISKKRKRSASNCKPRDLALNGSDTPLVNNSNVDVVIKEVETRDEFICESTSKIADREVFTTFSKSSGSTYEEHCLDELVLGGERENVFARKVGETDGNEDTGNYFLGVDPITIPGPPGSFLPSPRHMGSEELQGNSSLSTCKVQSSEKDEHELVDMYSSDSPISTVSNSVAEKSDHVSFMNLSIESHGVQPVTLFDIHMDRIDQETTTQGLEDGEPCCCSRKEGSLQVSPLIYQDSQISRQPPMNSLAIPSLDQQSRNTFPAFGNLESPSSSPSNSVLRLMGKNLMVVTKDENLSPQTLPTQSSVSNCHPGPPVLDIMQNEHHSFQHTFYQSPPVFDIMQNSMRTQHFGFNSASVGLRTYDVKNPLYSYPVQGYPIYSTVRNTNTKPPHPNRMNGNWNCSGEGSSHGLQLNPLTGSSPPYRGDPRYSMYFSTSFQ